jgi:hypothetical protein
VVCVCVSVCEREGGGGGKKKGELLLWTVALCLSHLVEYRCLEMTS